MLYLSACGSDKANVHYVQQLVNSSETGMMTTVQQGNRVYEVRYIPSELMARQNGSETVDTYRGTIVVSIRIPKSPDDSLLQEGSYSCPAVLALSDGRELGCIDLIHESGASGLYRTFLLVFNKPDSNVTGFAKLLFENPIESGETITAQIAITDNPDELL